MGNFYVNYTLRGPSQPDVAAALGGRSAAVTPLHEDCIVVFDEESDEQNMEIIAELAASLSGRFKCPLLLVLNHDDGFLWCQLYVSGELMDEYNSAPDYFNGDEDEDEEEVAGGPEGGDAQKLCAAFQSKAVAQVEKILRKPSAGRGGYVFASERHGDLTKALGISSFGAGTAFRQLFEDELPGELEESDLISTKDLPQPPPFTLKPIPGYYKVSFRADSRLKASIPIGWMPQLWAELDCAATDLSEGFHQAAASARETFKQLGFVEVGFKNITRILNPAFREGGGINYLDASRSHYGQLIYNRSYQAAVKAEKEQIVSAFTAVFDNEIFSCTNRVEPIPQLLRHHTVLRIKSDDIAEIHRTFLEHLEQRTARPRTFPDLPSLRSWFDSNAIELFEDRVQRGQWVRMSDYEAELARRKLS